MFQSQIGKLRNFLTIFLVVYGLIVLSGCSVFMAARQPDYKDLNVLSVGAPRSRVIAELGAPVLTEERDGKKVDIFSFKQGYGKGNKAARALFHAAADVWTLGLWEVIGTPTEAIASGKKMQLEVVYNENYEVEKVNVIDNKSLLHKQNTSTPVKESVKAKETEELTQAQTNEPTIEKESVKASEQN